MDDLKDDLMDDLNWSNGWSNEWYVLYKVMQALCPFCFTFPFKNLDSLHWKWLYLAIICHLHCTFLVIWDRCAKMLQCFRLLQPIWYDVHNWSWDGHPQLSFAHLYVCFSNFKWWVNLHAWTPQILKLLYQTLDSHGFTVF